MQVHSCTICATRALVATSTLGSSVPSNMPNCSSVQPNDMGPVKCVGVKAMKHSTGEHTYVLALR